jgi:hypothetical protein
MHWLWEGGRQTESAGGGDAADLVVVEVVTAVEVVGVVGCEFARAWAGAFGRA